MKERFVRKLEKEEANNSKGSSMSASGVKGRQKDRAGKDVGALINKPESLLEAKVASSSDSD
eukprot:scaffold356992_cov17-Prasinocladus_malaysianus.AAC.1